MAGAHNAGPAATGYLFQARHALLLLIKAPNDAEISLEKFDDIAFEQNGEPIQLIQTKHHKSRTGSLSDASEDLWKTIGGWCDGLVSNAIDPRSVVLTIVTTGVAPESSAAARLRPVGAGRNAATAREILEGVAIRSKSQTNKAAYAKFMALSDESRDRLVEAIRVLDGSNSILDVKSEIVEYLRLFCTQKGLEKFYEKIEGWWFGRVIKHLATGSQGAILYHELHAEINDARDQMTQDNLPIDFLDATIPDEQDLPTDQRTFLAQLRLITVTQPRVRSAISDFYRAFHQRSKWVRDDLLLVGEFDKYEKRLIDEWGRLFDIMKEDLADGADEATRQREGRSLYNAIQKRTDLPIRPKVTEAYVMRGTYHVLANRQQVGWHADFIDRLRDLIAPPPKVHK